MTKRYTIYKSYEIMLKGLAESIDAKSDPPIYIAIYVWLIFNKAKESSTLYFLHCLAVNLGELCVSIGQCFSCLARKTYYDVAIAILPVSSNNSLRLNLLIKLRRLINKRLVLDNESNHQEIQPLRWPSKRLQECVLGPSTPLPRAF